MQWREGGFAASKKIAMKKRDLKMSGNNTFGDAIKPAVNHFISAWRVYPFKGFLCCSSVSHVSGIC